MSIIIKSGVSGDTAVVKAASTAPAATDPAVVVSISPNTPALSVSLPAGAATSANQTTLGNQTTKINDGTNTLTVNSNGSISSAAEDTSSPTFVASVSAQANTAASDAIAIEAGPSMVTRLQRIIIFHPGKQGTAGIRLLSLVRTTTPGTAGIVTPGSCVSTETFSGIVRAKPTALGAAGAVIMTFPIFVPAALAAFTPIIIDLDAFGLAKSMKITAGGGISLRDPGAASATDFAAAIVFTEQAT